MKLASITVAYNPDIRDLFANISSYADNVDLLIIWDNSDRQQNDWSAFSTHWPTCIIHVAGGNKGLPEAYNAGIVIAREHGCTHLMTMDQDSRFEHFDVYRQQIEACRDGLVGIFVSPINCPAEQRQEQKYMEWACQSSSTFSLAMIDQIGNFRNDLFIDMVDTEMSLKAVYSGYKILQLSQCNLIHQIGNTRQKSLLGRRYVTPNYTPLRHYYQSRNRILMWHQFPNDYSFRHRMAWLGKRLHIVAKVLVAEDDKLRKVAATCSGTFWGLRNQAHPCPQWFK